jgi:hypothetical protein
MSVYGGIPGCSSQVFTLLVRNVLPVSLDVPFGQPKVNQKYFVSSFVESHTEIVRLNVSMDEVPVVDILNSGDHLIDQHEYSLE